MKNLAKTMVQMTNESVNRDSRIKYLLYKIQNNTATNLEREEYIDLLYQGGYINMIEYNQYKNDLKKGKTDTIQTLVTIGLAILLGIIIAESLKEK